MEKFDMSLNHLQMGRMVIEASKSIERKKQNKDGKIEFMPNPSDAESDFTQSNSARWPTRCSCRMNTSQGALVRIQQTTSSLTLV